MVNHRGLYLIAGICLICVLMLFGGKSHADSVSGVVGSKHDLSVNSAASEYTYQTEQVCVFCHTPHGAINATPAPVASNTTFSSAGIWNSGSMDQHEFLWNRSLSNAVSYTPYATSTFTNAPTNLRIYSLLCLSCHDGVGAMNVLTDYPSDGVRGVGGGLQIVKGYSQIGGIGGPYTTDSPVAGGGMNPNIGGCNPGQPDCVMDLANDHPVSMDYTSTLANPDPEFVPIENVVASSHLLFFPSPTDNWDFQLGHRISMECATCHDVHNEGNPADVNGTYPFLRDTLNKSQLCEDCHKK